MKIKFFFFNVAVRRTKRRLSFSAVNLEAEIWIKKYLIALLLLANFNNIKV